MLNVSTSRLCSLTQVNDLSFSSNVNEKPSAKTKILYIAQKTHYGRRAVLISIHEERKITVLKHNTAFRTTFESPSYILASS